MLTASEKNIVSSAYDQTCRIFDKVLDPQILKMQVEDLSDLPVEKILHALTEYRKNSKNNFWPRASKIRELVNPTQSTDTLANEAASRIRKAITDFGWCNAQKAREYIGELGWRIVERSGGWQYVCENHGVDLNPLTFHAQARELAKSIIESETLGFGDRPIEIPAPKNEQNKLTFGEVLSLADRKKE